MDQKSETQTGVGGGSAAEAASMLKQFVQDVRGFQERVETKLKTQDDRIAQVDRKASSGVRPTLSAANADPAPERKAVAAYLRRGDESGFECKALQTGDDAQGGVLVNVATAAEIVGAKRRSGSLRGLANVVTIEGSAYEVLVDHDELSSAWVTETAAATESTTSTLSRVSIPLHEVAAMPKASQRLLEDSAFDVERWLVEAIAEKFARAESAAFVKGDGVTMPKGILDYTLSDAETWRWGDIQYVPTGVSGGFNATDPANDLIDLVYSLGSKYRANAAFVMSSATAGVIRKLKDVDGRFLWHEGLRGGEPARLLGYPVAVCEDMPGIGADAPAIAFGDFHAGYTIAERRDLRILRDPYSAKPHVQFYVSHRVGGAVVDFEAIRVLKFGVS